MTEARPEPSEVNSLIDETNGSGRIDPLDLDGEALDLAAARAQTAVLPLKRRVELLRRRLLEGADLHTYRGLRRFHAKVINEAVNGNLTQKSARTLSALVDEQLKVLTEERQDLHRERDLDLKAKAVSLLREHGSLPAIPLHTDEMLKALDLVDLVDPAAPVAGEKAKPEGAA